MCPLYTHALFLGVIVKKENTLNCYTIIASFLVLVMIKVQSNSNTAKTLKVWMFMFVTRIR